MADRIGQQLGNYRLIRLLGRGGFAEVYLGEHLRLKTQAAIKVLHTSLDDEDVEGFLREAQTVARLKHPQIVRVFDFDVEGHTPFLVMDYLPNGNIRRSHPKGTPLPLNTIASYIVQVASALQYAHDEKLIHRDIKPENMLLDQRNTVVLSDFGIALIAQSSRYQSIQEVAGTAAYMAPEQFQGKPRRASDQYALGIVVYEWLTGDRPFHGSFSEIASQHLFVPPPSLHEKVPELPLPVEEVVLTALEKDPNRRFESVQAFATILGQTIHSASLSPVTSPTDIISANRSSQLTAADISPSLAISSTVVRRSESPSEPQLSKPRHLPHTALNKLASEVLLLLVGAGVLLWLGNTLNSWILTGSVAVLLSVLVPVLLRSHASTEPLNSTFIDRDREVRVWNIGVRQVVTMILGSTIYSVLLVVMSFLQRPTFINCYLFSCPIIGQPSGNLYAYGIALFIFGLLEVVPLFFGAVFGPWVGLFTGGVSIFIAQFIVEISDVNLRWIFLSPIDLLIKPLELALMSFIAGLALFITRGAYNTIRTIAIAEGFSILGKIIVLSLLILVFFFTGSPDLSYTFRSILSSLLSSLPGLVLLPLLLVAYTYNTARKHK